ncbi:MinD/ParA family protein [Alkalicoccobacillus murimartini]|uniref:Flagellar biosynthesis protein FlhG n=1 Tax=Alkalicoccobacillus murimartini TaxID=171685 RepID=A0ABT9YFP6_9BACI|nr:MinD/ParA family protein [Alkalicoccobacillus murimartini]MDQ0206325.1 flagellar biosynthesis protein FlhG [Alkalicoccobacillus murimartini]
MDQAESLRRRMNKTVHARIIAVASGKGGVGKSNLVVNTALGLNNIGHRTLILDMDSGMGNIDVIMGVQPSYHLIDMIKNRLAVWDVIESTSYGVSYIAGGSGLSDMAQFSQADMSYFQQQLQSLSHHFDYIFLDLGAGVTEESLQLLSAADDLIIVTTPEPTALTDAYSLLKQLTRLPDKPLIFAVANQTDSEKEGAHTLANLSQVAKQFLQLEIVKLGCVPHDRVVSRAVKAQIPYSVYQTKSKVSMATTKIMHSYLSFKKEEWDTVQKTPFFQRLSRWMSESTTVMKNKKNIKHR